jgi:hypothetical protein
MTDRAQPGAQGSTLRNIEAGESSQTLSDGFIVPANEPTLSSQRYADLDESQYEEFDASYSDSSLDVTIKAGEAFIKGWLARDTQTTVTLTDFTDNQTVVLAWDADSVYDDSIHNSREDADSVIITLESDLPTLEVPYIPIWEFDTDGDGVTDAIDERPIAESRMGAHHVPPSFPTLDDFESDSLEGYVEVNNLALTTDRSFTGTQSVVNRGDDSDGDLLSPVEIRRDFRFRHILYVDSWSDSELTKYFDFQFGTRQNVLAERDEGYQVRLDVEDPRLKMVETGTQSRLASSTSLTVPTDEWFILEVELTYTGITARVLNMDESEVTSINATDDTYQRGYWQARVTSKESDVDAFMDIATRKQL